MRVTFAIAGIGSRFLAVAIDAAIQICAGLLVGIGLLALRFLAPSLAPAWMLAALIASAFLLIYGYFLLFEIFWRGQTPGKRLIGIRVIKETGRPLAVAETIARNLLRILDQLPGFYAVGLVSAILNKQNKRLGDFVAGSIVIREESLRTLRSGWQAEEPLMRQPPQVSVNLLAAQDIVLIETFLQRRYDLSPDVRYRMARQLLGRFEEKLEIKPEEIGGAEKTLEAVVYAWRSTGRVT